MAMLRGSLELKEWYVSAVMAMASWTSGGSLLVSGNNSVDLTCWVSTGKLPALVVDHAWTAVHDGDNTPKKSTMRFLCSNQ